jgi:carbon storage regulator CsrA
MLILSRKPDETILFPNLGIKLEILQVNGKTVKVGIDAPREIAILRGELTEGAARLANLEKAAAADSKSSPSTRTERHELRNRIHMATMALQLLQKQLEAGLHDKAGGTLQKAIASLGMLDEMAVQPVEIRKSIRSSGTICALVVEDNANEREMLVGFLELCGYQAIGVSDGNEALDYLANHPKPDVVLLDVNMPNLDGPDTVTAIRSNPEYANIRLYMISGEDRSAFDVPMGVDGIQQWFNKPLQPSQLIESLS